MRDSRALTFELQIIPEGEQSYRVAIWQRTAMTNGEGQPQARHLVTIGGAALHLAMDQVLDLLKREGHRVTVLRPAQAEPLALSDEAGVRLGLLFLALKPLSKVSRMEAVAAGLRSMPAEEAYYWFSKCSIRQHARRAQQALRILLAGD